MTTVKFTKFDATTKNPMIPTVDDISPSELRAKKSEVHIVDVRRPDEWVGEFGHIPEATLVTLDTLPARVHELPRDKTIVFVCRSGARSAQAAAFAHEHGITSAFNMKGGMIEWTKLNFETSERNGGN